MRYVAALIVMILTSSFSNADSVSAEPKDDELDRYAAVEKRVTELEWNLLKFNLIWHESYREGEYVKSHPVYFDYESMKFKVHLRVANKRSYNDSEPFFSLSAIAQHKILQDVCEYLVDLLGQHFPAVSKLNERIEILFIYMEPGGKRSTVAAYNSGRLDLQK